MERTITVKSWVGDKQVTKDEFVSTWTDQLSTLWCICNDEHDHALREEIMTNLKFIASKHFNLECERQGVPSQKTIDKQSILEFVDYVLSFYGSGEIYDLKAEGYVNCELTRNNIYHICSGYARTAENFEGDTVDREQVRDLIIKAFPVQEAV